ncbi:MAG: CBS domain-containing protein [Gemmatimonadaceae bacterium]
MRAREIMTSNPECCEPDDTAREAAQVMRDHDCGCVPIVDPDSNKVIGVVTDRDLAVRGIAEGKDTDTRLRALMTPVATCCGPDDDVRDVERTMADLQVRRIPIVDADGRCLGIISQADIARACRDNDITEQEIALVVEQISEPARKGGTHSGVRRGADSGVSAQF